MILDTLQLDIFCWCLCLLCRLWSNLDGYLVAEVRWRDSCSTHLNFSWLFIHLIVVLCFLIFPKWFDFPEWECCSKWKGLQCLECLTLYKSKSRKVTGLREWGGILKRSGRPEDTRVIWQIVIAVLPHSEADEISLFLFRFPGRVQVFINQLTTELKASTSLLKFEFLLQGRVS